MHALRIFHPVSRSVAAALVAAGGVPRSTAGPSDAVMDWNVAVTSFLAAEAPPDLGMQVEARVLTLMHAAIQEAAEDVRRGERDNPAAATPGAIAVAAGDVLEEVLPFAARRFQTLVTGQLRAWPDSPARARGIRYGHQAAARVIESRKHDQWPVVLVTRPGDRSALAEILRQLPETAEPQPRAATTRWESQKLFGLKRVTQFWPQVPYYTHDNGRVSANESLRDSPVLGNPPALEAGDPWVPLWRQHPVVVWNCVAEALARQREEDIPARARLFRLLNAALADALVTAAHWRQVYAEGRQEVDPWMSSPVPEIVRREAALAQGDLTAAFPTEAPPGLRVLISGYPDLGATLAGAAHGVLTRLLPGAESTLFQIAWHGNAVEGAGELLSDPIDLKAAVSAAVWATGTDRSWAHEAGIAGYELGREIGKYVSR